MLLETKEIEVADSNSVLGFATEGGGAWKIWDRYLTIDGKHAYHIGNICNTCSFFFERLDGANKGIGSGTVADLLNRGISALDDDVVAELSRIMPTGKYEVLLQQASPKLVQLSGEGDYFAQEQVDLWGINRFWGLPHSPKIRYYRLPDTQLSSSERVFQFVVPMFPDSWLKQAPIAGYASLLQKGGSANGACTQRSGHQVARGLGRRTGSIVSLVPDALFAGRASQVFCRIAKRCTNYPDLISGGGAGYFIARRNCSLACCALIAMRSSNPTEAFQKDLNRRFGR